MIIQTNIDLRSYSTFGLRAKAKYMATIKDASELNELYDFIDDIDAPSLQLGGGSNMLFCTDYPGVIVRNTMANISLHTPRKIRCGAGAKLDDVVSFSIEHGAYGLEPLSYIPGTIGGAIALNAGAYGTSISHILDSVRVYDIDNNSTISLDAKELGYWHRTSVFRSQRGSRWIILDADLKVSQKPLIYNHQKLDPSFAGKELRQLIHTLRAHLPDPEKIKNAGSFFLNPTITNLHAEKIRKSFTDCAMRPYDKGHQQLASGWLLEHAGLKGTRIHNFYLSDEHANIVINENPRATGRDVRIFIDEVNTRISELFSLELEPEPLLIGGLL